MLPDANSKDNAFPRVLTDEVRNGNGNGNGKWNGEEISTTLLYCLMLFGGFFREVQNWERD